MPLVDADVGVGFTFEVALDVGRPEELELIVEAHCVMYSTRTPAPFASTPV